MKPQPAGARLEGFDGLRACAALAVVAYHTSLLSGLTRTGPLAPLLSELKAGVAIFFVISGFLLYLPYATAICDDRQLPDWRDFGRRRAIRILPGYWVTLTILAAGPLASTVLTSNWWRFYGLAQIYNPVTLIGGLGVAWSLCVEVTFYATLPVFARCTAWLAGRAGHDTAKMQLRIVAALGASSLVLRAVLSRSLVGPIAHGPLVATSLPGMLDWFALGMGMAVIRSRWEVAQPAAPRLARLAADPARCWLLAAGLFCVGLPWQHGDLFLPLYGLPTHVAIGLGSAALVLPAVSIRGARVHGSGRAIAWPIELLTSLPMAWLGTISYGIYLWHNSVLEAILGRTTVPASPSSLITILSVLVVTVLGAVALGAASWYLVERPAQRRWRPRPQPLLAVAA